MPPLDRQQISIHRSHADADDGGYMPGTPAERLSEVWDLTRDEQRLQREVAVTLAFVSGCVQLVRGRRVGSALKWSDVAAYSPTTSTVNESGVGAGRGWGCSGVGAGGGSKSAVTR